MKNGLYEKMTIQIIEGNINQLEEIVGVNYTIFSGMYEHEPYSLEEYRKRLAGKKPLIYLVMDDDKLIGDSISFEKDGSFYIWIMGVLSKYRGRGIGTRLLEFNEEYARREGFKSVTTKVYDVSPEMQKLLTKRGYRVAKEDKDVKHFELDLG